jgi:hypothetical protein
MMKQAALFSTVNGGGNLAKHWHSENCGLARKRSNTKAG